MAGLYRDVAPLRSFDQKSEAGEVRTELAVPITVVEPEGRARGGVVVLHESREVTDALLGLLRTLAGAGWVTVVPNLFHHEDETAGDAAESEGVFGDTLFADFDACFDWLIRQGVFADCIGVLGFDAAGTAAFLVGINRPIGAAVSIAPRGIVSPLAPGVPALVAAAPALQAPWLGLFGADDPITPAAQIEQLSDAVSAAVVATNVVSYPGLRHRADRLTFPHVDPDQDESELVDAQTRIFDWFDSFLR